MNRLLCFVLALASLSLSRADVRVVTSLPDLADFAQRIGGDKVKVDFIVKGNQNPHFVDVKPSYMMKLKSADIFFIIGMEFELWAPQLVDGSRNANLNVVDLSRAIQKMEVPAAVNAGMGDVHRYGNPHYWLDPRNIRIVAGEMVDALTKASPVDEAFFRGNAEAYLKKLDAKIVEWQAQMKPFAGSRIITFHKSWSYFANWLGLVIAGQVEPLPGIAPTPGHTSELIQLCRQGNIKAIIVEPFYDMSAPEQIARSTSAKVLQLPTSVGGVDGAEDYIALMDHNISTMAATLR
ncbi:MAG: zinc transporter substrate-binding protein [Bacteroidetes bacterium]|nr:zinc transporter substrate-binding protein [Bacteroidota bacterium]